MNKKIQKRTLTDEVFHILKERIFEGYYQPGDRLKQEHLCEELGVSSSPVREALNKLENEQWIQNVPHKGRVVREVDEQEIEETYRVRCGLEMMAIEEALPKIREKDIKELYKLAETISKMVEKKDVPALVDAEIAFHSTIVELSENKTLLNFFTILVQRGKGFLTRQDFFNEKFLKKNIKQMKDEHREIVDALAEKDFGKVQSIIKSHVRIRKEFFDK